jgi:crossover junction endodeoxyribonuclease RuvC
MRILGIDCGTERTGYGAVESDGRKHSLIRYGVIRTSPKDPLETRLVEIAAGLREAIRETGPAAVAVEEVFHAQNARTALKLAHVRGVALLTIAEAGLPLGEYSPMAIKNCVAGYGRAEKQQVELMVRTLLRLGAPVEPNDASDALAIAICHACLGRIAVHQ